MPIFHRVVLRFLGCVPAVLLVACAVPGSGPPPAAIDNVRSVEIQYQYSGWSHTDEVHRLQRSGGQRAFTRTSKVETAEGVETTQATVPAQRVGELVWALAAPPWPRERAVQVVARRVPAAWMMENALIFPHAVTCPAVTGKRRSATACFRIWGALRCVPSWMLTTKGCRGLTITPRCGW